MLRLFVALPVSEAISDRLAVMQSGVPDAHWVHPEDFHITLAFIGEVDGGTAEEIYQALADVSVPRFDLRISELGTFGSGARIRALWAGVERSQALMLLQGRVSACLTECGVRLESRKYKPHVTLARMRAGPEQVLQRFIAGNNLFEVPSLTCDRFCVYRTQLTQSGPHYSMVAEYPLS